jgi:tripartite-type tricarboxylate transporter receptor subunit TctC
MPSITLRESRPEGMDARVKPAHDAGEKLHRLRLPFHTAALTLIALSLACPSSAQDWPTRPTRIVSFLAPGGLSDMLARILAQNLEAKFKSSFFVENRTGGGGVVGASLVAEQPPDGATLGISGIGSNVIAPAMNPSVGFDALKSFTHIAFLGGAPTVLVVNPSVPAKNLAELAALARAKPGLQFGSSGAGTHGHLIGELFKRQAGLDLVHIPYRGANPVMTDLIAGHVPAAFVTISSATEQLRLGKIRALAVTSSTRLKQFPDLPTFAEQGFPDLVALTWFALAGPAGMSPSVVTKINEAAVEIMASPAVARQLEHESIEVLKMNAADFTAFVQREIERWGPFAKAVGGK